MGLVVRDRERKREGDGLSAGGGAQMLLLRGRRRREDAVARLANEMD
jgi:hypothetical protein